MKKREFAWPHFLLCISLAVILSAFGIFIGIILKDSSLMDQEILARAKAHISHILMTRAWNAHYGGVYVEKKEGVESNPYLKDPDIKTIDGKVYTLKNPAMMTREISEMFSTEGILTFHMSSLKYMNPSNKPDEFERHALELFEKGGVEASAKKKIDSRTRFRYMVPLFVKEECRKCHAEHGYKLGDLRGGISVEFDISMIEDYLSMNKFIILFMGSAAVIILLGIIYSFTFILKRKLDNAEKVCEKLGLIDNLTGLHNRRYFFQVLANEKKRAIRFEQSMGFIMLDVDRFKEINDRYGYDAGDMVLKKVAEAIKSSCRDVDTVARNDGGEFLVLFPGTGIEGVENVSEKIRYAIEKLRNIYLEDHAIFVTVSIGATAFTYHYLKNILDNNLIIKEADRALSKAKELGQNRVEKA